MIHQHDEHGEVRGWEATRSTSNFSEGDSSFWIIRMKIRTNWSKRQHQKNHQLIKKRLKLKQKTFSSAVKLRNCLSEKLLQTNWSIFEDFGLHTFTEEVIKRLTVEIQLRSHKSLQLEKQRRLRKLFIRAEEASGGSEGFARTSPTH